MDVRYLFFFKQKTAYEVRISGWSSDVCSSDLFFWHLDGMPMANIAPPKASVLSCRKKSPTGGQTQFASTFAAYDALSDEEKRSEEHTSELQSLMRISYAVFCLKKKITLTNQQYSFLTQ